MRSLAASASAAAAARAKAPAAPAPVPSPVDPRAEEFRRILGVQFFVGQAQRAIELLSDGGLLVVPAAPALKNLPWDAPYREALLQADVALTDSSLMVLLWNLLQRDSIPRLSGLEYLLALLRLPALRQPGQSFWIMPSPASADTNLAWLRQHGIPVSPEDVYLAPIYSSCISDEPLLLALRHRRPAHIVVALGGGTQERLGLYLKRHLRPLPAIHCIGWLFRCLSQPSRFIPRYWSARKLVSLMFRYRDRLPVPQP